MTKVETFGPSKYIEIFREITSSNVLYTQVCVFLKIYLTYNLATPFTRHNQPTIMVKCNHRNIQKCLLLAGWQPWNTARAGVPHFRGDYFWQMNFYRISSSIISGLSLSPRQHVGYSSRPTTVKTVRKRVELTDSVCWAHEALQRTFYIQVDNWISHSNILLDPHLRAFVYLV